MLRAGRGGNLWWIAWTFLLTAGCGEELPRPDDARPPQATNENPKAPRPTDWFEDVTERSGVSFTYRNGREGEQFTLLESLGGGVGLIDYDRDGKLDVALPGGGSITSERVEGLPSALYRNEGDWKFRDVSRETSLGGPTDYSHGAFVGDYDADGFPDLFLTCYGRSRLFRNQGDGTVADATESAGLAFECWSTAAAWADFDRDGGLDLYVAGYCDWRLDMPHPWCGDKLRSIRDACGPHNYEPISDRLFRGLSDGRFEEVTIQADLRRDGRGLGVVAADLNGDAWVDFYVANDATPNHLYLGGPRLPLPEVGVPAGVALSESGASDGSMGVDLADVDGDGRPDIFVTNMEQEDNALYRNLGHHRFAHRTVAIGLGGLSYLLVGFGTALADFDLDGWPDVFISNGNVAYFTGVTPFRHPACLYRNRSGQRFDDVMENGGPYFRAAHPGRGAAVGDLDNDGDLDLVVSHLNERVSLLRNRTDPESWIRVSLRGIESPRDAVGGAVSVRGAHRTVTQWTQSGAGYLSTFDPRLIFPVDGQSPVTASVRWPNGNVEHFRDLQTGEYHELVEGSGQRDDATGQGADLDLST